MKQLLVLLLWSAILVACAPVDPPVLANPGESIAQQLLRVAPFLKDAQFSTLLDFESPDDAVFINVPGKGGGPSLDRAFTGRGSFRIESSTSTLSIKLGSLLAGRPFPGEWSMVGGYFYCSQPMKLTARLESSTVTTQFDMTAGVWTPVFIDLPASLGTATPAALAFDLTSPHGTVWFDDIMLVNNQKSLTAAAPTPTDAAWQVTRKGTQLSGGTTGQFQFSLANADVSRTGWQCDEANALRARFHSLEKKMLTIYSDGRAFWNGEYRPMSGSVRDPGYAQQNQTPASLEIAENMGRVDRNTPGDANNDGYNETTGSYRILADGPRIEMHFSPAPGVPDPRPVLEISGLPFGKVLATLEGRLIDSTQRTADGHVLIELPAVIDRPVTVDVRIEN